ncbi:MAG: sigma-70 family RNA polymerase sigma factor [Prevotellaceae bacterium]|jgi:RNA polymerase sigma factor (sigma-70 family)|nr:sigma-70 family RNA polymerase sigma factor [Prevotellaceae bacterium]
MNTMAIKNSDAPTRAMEARSFSLLYNSYSTILFNYGCKLTTDHELLRDCIHDVFVKLYVRKEHMDEIDNLKSYLFTSLRNKLCDEMRRRTNLSDVSVDECTGLRCEADIESEYLNTERILNQKRKVEYMLGKLTPRQRKALILYYIEEREYDDICGIMNMNYQSIRNLIHRGMLKLRSQTALRNVG